MTEGAPRPVRLGARPARRVTLTKLQSQIWASQRLHPDAALANMAHQFRIRGAIDPDRLVRAVDTVVRGAQVLRIVVDAAP